VAGPLGAPAGDPLAQLALEAHRRAQRFLRETAGLLEAPGAAGREGAVPDLLRPRRATAGVHARLVTPVVLRRVCQRCDRRRRCVLVVELLAHTTAWLCRADCAREVEAAPLVRAVYVEET
jgi:hypothetical protein